MYRAKCDPYIFPKIHMGLILVYQRFRLAHVQKKRVLPSKIILGLRWNFWRSPIWEPSQPLSQKVTILHERGALFRRSQGLVWLSWLGWLSWPASQPANQPASQQASQRSQPSQLSQPCQRSQTSPCPLQKTHPSRSKSQLFAKPLRWLPDWACLKIPPQAEGDFRR